ncbi:hypothetical protein [Bifidobacterium callitrichidarum]|nr:hypothetical protein [Bifidobacterium callitrichidarum]
MNSDTKDDNTQGIPSVPTNAADAAAMRQTEFGPSSPGRSPLGVDSVLTSSNEYSNTAAKSSSMGEELDRRRLDMLQRCTDEAKRMGRQLLFGMTTSLILQSVPLPAECDLETEALHTVSSARNRRIRARNSALRTHLWKHVATARKVKINGYVLALDLFHVWAQLSTHLSFASLVVLGDAIVAATSSQPRLARGRDADAVYADLVRFTQKLPLFKGRESCIKALPLIMPGSGSPKESELRLALLRHGLPCPELNYTVPNLRFASGVVMTVDMAWPDCRIAVEYDGDHHRTDKTQWRRDQEKRSRLLGRGWAVFVATAASIQDESAAAEFAFAVARALALRGCSFAFRVLPMPLERLARRMRRLAARPDGAQ